MLFIDNVYIFVYRIILLNIRQSHKLKTKKGGVMENILLKYMSERLPETKIEFKEPGPVITISRDHGCNANEIACSLAEKLNTKSGLVTPPKLWRCINKEIIEKSALALHADPSHISHIFNAEVRGFLGDIIVSFSNKQYASDDVIKKTITKVIRSYAEEGHVILVGRAGCIITCNIKKALHVKLVAPLEWRINEVATRYNMSHDAAKACVIDMDKKRNAFMEFYKSKKQDCEIYHAVYNCMMLSKDEIVDMIQKMAEAKKVV